MKQELKEHLIGSDLPIEGQVDDVLECISGLIYDEDPDGSMHVSYEEVRDYLRRYDDKVLR